MRPHLVRDGGILKRAVAPRAKPRGLHLVQNVAGEGAVCVRHGRPPWQDASC